MTINEKLPVGEFLALLEAEHQMRAIQIEWLRKELGRTNGASVPARAVASPKLGPSLADRAISAIKAAGRALTLDEIVKELLAQGVDGSSENFRTTVYTGLKRRAQDLRRTENGLWDIRVAVVK